MYLENINIPADLKSLKLEELPALCEEIRNFLQEKTSTKEGHIRSSLGVTELTVALHYVFNTPHDILIWDVGHQAYVHKILTGRKNRFQSNRQKGGISGFTKSSESPYDPFGAGHSSTSISAAVGFAAADRFQNIDRQHIVVIGDGAITGGMSFEALNYLGEQQLDVIVILNDNSASIDQNVGALAAHKNYRQYVEALNIRYCGEVDGHNVEEILNFLNEVRNLKGPRFIRVITEKGKGRKLVQAPENSSVSDSFQNVFSESMLKLGREDERIVAITPAMLSGSGLDRFQEVFAGRCFDVGIAEQHAVTMAAAMAADGLRPLVHLYSTFSQRAYDQIIHDVALQNLPVVFCLDRAGVAGADGATHHGTFDPGFLNTIPNLTVAAPVDGRSLEAILREAFNSNGPWAIRYPKDGFEDIRGTGKLMRGKARRLKEGEIKAVLSFGAVGGEVAKALKGTALAHYDFPYLKPLDTEMLRQIAGKYEEVICIEENSARGGFGDSIRAHYSEMDVSIKMKSLALPDHFIEQGTRRELLQLTGLDAEGIRKFISAP